MVYIPQPTYKVGDLVKIYDTRYDAAAKYVEYGLVVGCTIPWDEAYELTKTDDDSGTRYWNNANYSPYHVMMLGTRIGWNRLEWVSPEYMAPAYKE